MAFNFVDRVSTYANRALVTPENGEAFYATIVRADAPVTDGTPLNAETFNTMQEDFLEKTGGEVNGTLNFTNDGEYLMIDKTRTFNGKLYKTNMGIGTWAGYGCISWELREDGVLQSRLEVHPNAVYFRDAAGARHAMIVGTAVSASVE